MASQRGLSFPISKDPNGYWQFRTREQLIRSSLEMILGTRPGERVHLPDFGSRLEELELEPNDAIFEVLAREYVVEAILRWENRVEVVDVRIVQVENIARIVTVFVDRDDPRRNRQEFVSTLQRA